MEKLNSIADDNSAEQPETSVEKQKEEVLESMVIVENLENLIVVAALDPEEAKEELSK